MLADKKELNTPNQDDFDDATRRRANGRRVSALFGTVKNMVGAQDPLLKDYRISTKETEERTAYFISSKKAPGENIFLEGEEYRTTEFHLSVDEYHVVNSSEKSRKLTAAHFTVELTHPTKPKISLHCYYNFQGRYVGTLGREAPDRTFTLSTELEQYLRNNAQPFESLLARLIHLRNEGNHQAKEHARLLQSQLESLSLRLNNSSNRSQFIQLGHKFIRAVETINSTSDVEVDNRSMAVRTLIKRISVLDNETYKAPSSAQDTLAGAETAENVKTITSATQVAPKKMKKKAAASMALTSDPIHKENDAKLLIELQELEKILGKPELQPQTLFEAYQHLDEIKEELRELILFGNYSNKKMIKRFDQLCDRFPKPLEVLKKCVVNGDVTGFKLIFPRAKDEINYKFLFDLFQAIILSSGSVVKKHPERINKIIECFDFIFENSETYRNYYSILSTSTFSLTDRKYSFSLLLSALMSDFFDLFCMLLRHGYNPNSCAISYHDLDGQETNLSILTIIVSGKQKRLNYLMELVKHGVTADRRLNYSQDWTTIEADQLSQNPNLDTLRNHGKKSTATPFDPENLFEGSEQRKEPFAIVRPIYSENYEMMLPLAPISSLEALSLALINVILIGDLSWRFHYAAISPGIHFINSSNAAEALINLKSAVAGSSDCPGALALIAFPGNPLEPGKIQALNQLCATFKTITHRNQKMIVGLADSLTSKGESEQSNIQRKFAYFLSAFTLMMQKEKPDFMDTQKILRLLYLIGLNCANPLVQNGQHQSKAMAFYRAIIDTAKYSQFRTGLQNTPTFKLAVRKLENTPLRFVPENDSKPITTAEETNLASFLLHHYRLLSKKSYLFEDAIPTPKRFDKHTVEETKSRQAKYI